MCPGSGAIGSCLDIEHGRVIFRISYCLQESKEWAKTYNLY